MHSRAAAVRGGDVAVSLRDRTFGRPRLCASPRHSMKDRSRRCRERQGARGRVRKRTRPAQMSVLNARAAPPDGTAAKRLPMEKLSDNQPGNRSETRGRGCACHSRRDPPRRPNRRVCRPSGQAEYGESMPTRRHAPTQHAIGSAAKARMASRDVFHCEIGLPSSVRS